MDYSLLKEFLEREGCSYRENEPMANHTTFKIGGNADVLIKIKSVSELKQVISITNELEVPRFILGKGSNLLVSDSGIEGAVISLQGIDGIEIISQK